MSNSIEKKDSDAESNSGKVERLKQEMLWLSNQNSREIFLDKLMGKRLMRMRIIERNSME